MVENPVIGVRVLGNLNHSRAALLEHETGRKGEPSQTQRVKVHASE